MPIFLERGSGTWNVFSYNDVERVLTQFSTFSSEFGGYDGSSSSGDSEEANIMGSMLTTDPPFHTKAEEHRLKVVHSGVDFTA